MKRAFRRETWASKVGLMRSNCWTKPWLKQRIDDGPTKLAHTAINAEAA
jgi:hypothetical protein